MSVVSRLLAILAFGAVAVPAAAGDYRPLPSACEILDSVGARAHAGIADDAGDPIEMALQERYGVRLSGCNLPSPGLFGYGLLLREETGDVVRPAAEQMADIMCQHAEVWGEEAAADPVALGEAAVWIEEFRQFWIIARQGHAYLIVSVPEDADSETAAAFAALVLSGVD